MTDGRCICSPHQQPRCAHFRMGRCDEKIVQFPTRLTNPGNGALEVLKRYFGEEHNWPDHIPAMTEADYFLAWLWMEGFLVCPVSNGDRA